LNKKNKEREVKVGKCLNRKWDVALEVESSHENKVCE